MNKITLAFFIFQVTFALSDFSPYRGECSRIGNFDIHVNGKKLYLFFCSLSIPAWKRTTSTDSTNFILLQEMFRQDKFHRYRSVLITELFVLSTFRHILAWQQFLSGDKKYLFANLVKFFFSVLRTPLLG